MNSNDPSLNKPDPLKPSSEDQPLSEQDFIQNGWSFFSLPFWLWIFLITILIALIFGGMHWYHTLIYQEKKHDPFLEVTNRNFSLFLWQFPSFLRVNVSKKTGYLPSFFYDAENFDSTKADDFVSAPPDLIFLYHTWHRLLASDYMARPIDSTEFTEFLERLPEWKPEFWKQAPKDYVNMVESNSYTIIEDLQILPESTLPLIVRQAFQGWKNYFKEGPEINQLNPTIAQVQSFLKKYPTYSRNYWRNISEINNQPVAGENYLLFTLDQLMSPELSFPSDQLSSFLKVALFNAQQAQQNQ